MRFSLALVAAANILALVSAAPAEAAAGAVSGTTAGAEISTVSGSFKTLDTSAAPGTDAANGYCGNLTPAQCIGICRAFGYPRWACTLTSCRCSFT